MTTVQRWALGVLLLWSFVLRLLFSWPDPTMSRWIDERYNAENVAAILAHGQWQPVLTHYPSLSYLPHALILKVYEAARSLPALSDSPSAFGTGRDENTHLSRLGLRVCRSIHALVGAASLWVLFLIGDRLFEPGIALTAAFLVSVSPWHLILSAMFKPDIMLVLTSLLALYAMLHARRSESLKSYALAGSLVGATAAAKWNGAALALPLLLTIGLGGLKHYGLTLRRAASAAAAAAAVFFLLNPWSVTVPGLYRHHLRTTFAFYDMKLSRTDGVWFDQPLSAAVSFLRTIYFSPVFGTCALIGLGLMLAVCLRDRRTPGRSLAASRHGATIADGLILLTFYGGYVGSLWAATRYARPPNWLIIAPVAALAGAWVIGWFLTAVRAAPRAWIRHATVGTAVVVLGLAGVDKVRFLNRFVYDATVPSAAVEAARLAGERKPLRGRVFFSELEVEKQDFHPRIWNSDFVPTLIQTTTIYAEPSAELEVADALIFPASRLESDQDPLYRALAGADREYVSEFRPRLFRLRGPEPVILVRQAFESLGAPTAAPFAAVGEGIFEVDIGGTGPGTEDAGGDREVLSMEIAIRAPSDAAIEVVVEIEGRQIACRRTQKGQRRRRCLTPRIPTPLAPLRVSLVPAYPIIDVSVFRWRGQT